ncbi:hypothetical protein [Sphingopyxis sp.]|uniref:hypothetical protein n=1 Tax=Sphingopyxis sp. TaxID=1908224 RepID=UPI0025F3A233|nr:hypothetical protein [Sphingopyxis sp.]MBK6414316.1 hypothetical protein [Sphingopyxis sp.]
MGKIFDLLRFLYVQRVSGFDPPGDEPFMPLQEVERFKAEIGRANFYVEFGSGGSTVYASAKGIRGVSVESDRYFARSVATKLAGTSIDQVVVDMGLVGKWGKPLFPSKAKAKRYISAPWREGPFPDFILVDGRYRIACALETARRAEEAGAIGTLMVDDYGHRPHYLPIAEILGTPEMVGRGAIFRIGTQQVPISTVEKWLDDPF